MRKLKIGVIISGRGSNLQSLIDACAKPTFPAEIQVVISNRPGVYGLERAQLAGIKTATIDHKSFDGREDFEDSIQAELEANDVELVCLAGFMRILNAEFVSKWRDRMLNVHPSLLPAFKGLHTHERAIEAGCRFTGCTIHYVVPELDAGPIILQTAVPIAENDTSETLAEKVLEYEHSMYPEAVRLIAENRVRVSGHKALIKDMQVPDTGLINPVPQV